MKNKAFTLIEVMITLVIAGIIIVLTLHILKSGMIFRDRQDEREMLYEQLQFGLMQIENDVHRAMAFSDGKEKFSARELPKNRLCLLIAESINQKKGYRGENEIKKVVYGIKQDEFKAPKYAPRNFCVLYRSEGNFMFTDEGSKEPVAMYLNGEYDTDPGLVVLPIIENGTCRMIKVTLNGRLKNGQLISLNKTMSLGLEGGYGIEM